MYLRAENQVQVSRALDVLRAEIVFVVVRRVATDAQVIHQLAHLLGLRLGPFKVGSVELDRLVSHLARPPAPCPRIALERASRTE